MLPMKANLRVYIILAALALLCCDELLGQILLNLFIMLTKGGRIVSIWGFDFI